MNEEKAEDALKEISDLLKIGEEKGLTCEMLYTTMMTLKRNPGMSIKEATDVGVGEWDK